ncbi:MAG: GAF domain-containing sensor histidine kinase [Aggregatilineales bacterium]
MNWRREQQRECLTRILEMARLPAEQFSLDDVLEQVARGIMIAAAADHCHFYLVSEDQSRLIPHIGVSQEPRNEQVLERFLNCVPDLSDDLFLRQALTRQEPAISSDVRSDPLVNRQVVTQLGIRSVMAVPLVAHNRVLALAMTGSPHNSRGFTTEQVEMAWNLARSAALVVDNVRLYKERIAESQGIQRVTSALLQKRELADLFQLICTEAQQLTGARGSAIYFLADDNGLQEIYSAGDEPTYQRIPLEGTLAGRVLVEGHSYIANHPTDDLQTFSHDPTLKNLLAAPLRTSTSNLGVLYVANKPGDFTQADAHLIDLFADQAAIAIENVQLHEQVRQLAALEERERLAREIHDNLAQALSVLKLQASYAEDLLRNGQYEQVQAYLGELKRMATEAHDDARDAIFSLRQRAASPEEFLTSIRAHLDRYHRLYGLNAELVVQDETLIDLTPAAVVQLTRIIQEALANVRKHALATSVCVQMERCDGQYCITVADDGQGFDPGELAHRERGAGGMGLQIMRERVESLGGTLEIDSEPGEGTRVIVGIPLAEMR